jgi:hypothetical protein
MFRTTTFSDALNGKKMHADLFFILSEKYFAFKKKKNSAAYINYG